MSVTVNDKVWRKLLAKLKRMENAHVKVGVLASQGGSAEHSEGITLIELAAIHEFGSPEAGIPKRSFIHDGVNKSKKIKDTMSKLSARVVGGTMSETHALEILGQVATAEIKNYVSAGAPVPPPNTKSTVSKKGSSRPLIDTGRMVNAVNHEVEK